MIAIFQTTETVELLSGLLPTVKRHWVFTPENYPKLQRIPPENKEIFQLNQASLCLQKALGKFSSNKVLHQESLRYLSFPNEKLSPQSKDTKQGLEQSLVVILSIASMVDITSEDIETLPPIKQANSFLEDLSMFDQKLTDALKQWDHLNMSTSKDLKDMLHIILMSSKYWLDHTWAKNFFVEIHESLRQ